MTFNSNRFPSPPFQKESRRREAPPPPSMFQCRSADIGAVKQVVARYPAHTLYGFQPRLGERIPAPYHYQHPPAVTNPSPDHAVPIW